MPDRSEQANVVVRYSPWLFARGGLLFAIVAGVGVLCLVWGAEIPGWPLLIGSGVIAAIFFLLMLVRPASILLDQEGLRVRLLGPWRRVPKVHWADVQRVGTFASHGGRVQSLLVTLRNPDRYLARLNELERRSVAGGSQESHLCIPLNAQTHTAEQVAAIVAERIRGGRSGRT